MYQTLLKINVMYLKTCDKQAEDQQLPPFLTEYLSMDLTLSTGYSRHLPIAIILSKQMSKQPNELADLNKEN